jgi:hypothetical protein
MAALRHEDPYDHDLVDSARTQFVRHARLDATLYARRLADVLGFEERPGRRSGCTRRRRIDRDRGGMFVRRRRGRWSWRSDRRRVANGHGCIRGRRRQRFHRSRPRRDRLSGGRRADCCGSRRHRRLGTSGLRCGDRLRFRRHRGRLLFANDRRLTVRQPVSACAAGCRDDRESYDAELQAHAGRRSARRRTLADPIWPLRAWCRRSLAFLPPFAALVRRARPVVQERQAIRLELAPGHQRSRSLRRQVR